MIQGNSPCIEDIFSEGARLNISPLFVIFISSVNLQKFTLDLPLYIAPFPLPVSCLSDNLFSLLASFLFDIHNFL
jgi:hypothetical protein